MKRRLLDILCCPACRADLALEDAEEKFGEVREGTLACTRCDARYPVVRYVPRFVTSDQYTGSFSLQRHYVRKHFKHYVSDKSGDARLGPYTGFDPRELRRGVTLEVGCGYGRFVNVVSQRGGEVVGVDLSTNSIDLAFDFVGRRPRVHLVQADVFRLPFKEGAFARAFSIGVLHHTPDPSLAVRTLAPKVTPGGRLSIWVYHPETSGKVVDRWRLFTRYLHPVLLYWLCVLNQALLSPVRKVPKVAGLLSRLVPGNWPHAGTRFWQRVIGDFDTLSPTHASTHEPEEALAWLEAAGLEGVSSLEPLTAVTGLVPLKVETKGGALGPDDAEKPASSSERAAAA
jgi:SAM-dependent methyltransferase